jgi:hypothetical protein
MSGVGFFMGVTPILLRVVLGFLLFLAETDTEEDRGG